MFYDCLEGREKSLECSLERDPTNSGDIGEFQGRGSEQGWGALRSSIEHVV
jgi:hypothetical protein